MESLGDVAKAIRTNVNLKRKEVDTDNLVFKLHYRLTFWTLLVFTTIVCGQELLKEKIRCTHSDPTDSRKQLEHVFETYCFFMTTFIVPRHYNKSLSSDATFTGVGPVRDSEETVSVKYYQWVPYVLFLQALSFYIPHYIWRRRTGAEFKKVVTDINAVVDGAGLNALQREYDVKEKVYKFTSSLQYSGQWYYLLILCEVMNFVNVILQMYLTDKFLGGRFWSLGTEVYEHYSSTRYNPLDAVFPKVAKCTFKKFGPSGSIQLHDAICVLSLNIIYEKGYLVLWYWYIILAVLSALILLHRIASFMLYRTKIPYNAVLFRTRIQEPYDSYVLLHLMENLSYTKWFFLEQLVINIKCFKIYNILRHVLDKNTARKGYIPELLPSLLPSKVKESSSSMSKLNY